MDYRNMLEQLQALHAAAGDELPLAEALQALAAPHCDTCTIDTLGNVVAHRKGDGPRLLLTAQMDVPGLVVTHVEESGELRVGKLGSLSLKAALYRPYRFKSGVQGVLSIEEEARDQKETTVQVLFLDIGAKDRAAAEALVQVGDTAVAAQPNVPMGNRLATAHGSLLACLVLLEAMEQGSGGENDLTFVFAAQGSLGMRGIKTAAFKAAAEYALTVGLTPASEREGKHHGSSKLSGGAAIKVMDQSVIAHPEVVERLEALAKAESIPHQRDVVRVGESAGTVLQLSGPGMRTGGLSIPCRYGGSYTETVDWDDVSACAKLLAAVCGGKWE